MTDVRLYSTMQAGSSDVPACGEPRTASPVQRAALSFGMQKAAPFVAEFVCSFILAFTYGSCLLAPGSPVWNSTSIGCVVMVMLYATGNISGGYMNPAVTLAQTLIGALEWRQALCYCVVQLCGGMLGGFCCSILYKPFAVLVEPGPTFTPWHALAAELAYTCVLCLVVSNCTASRRNNPRNDQNQFYGLAIGFVITAAGYAIGNVSGACLNPAVSISLDVTSFARVTGYGWSWALAEFLGGALAAALFRVVRQEDFGDENALNSYAPHLGTKCFSEFLGVFMLVFTVGLNVVTDSPASAWSAAAVLMSLTYSLGNISGGHFNPAVTLAVVLSSRRKITPCEGIAYILAQIAAGTLAGLAYGAFQTRQPHSWHTYGEFDGPWRAGIAEMIFTFVLAYAVLGCTTASIPSSWRTRQNSYFAFAVGACMVVGGVSINTVFGGKLNPAICFGMFVSSQVYYGVSQPLPVVKWLAFSVWQLFGGVLAANLFRFTHPAEFNKG